MTTKKPHADGELAWLREIDRMVGASVDGEVGIGDDAAVLAVPHANYLLFSSDLLTEGVHFDFATSSANDIGFKAMAVNLSDIAAMGGRALRCVIGLSGAGRVDLTGLYEGLLEAGRRFGCSVVGGDCSSGPVLTISIAVLGTSDDPPVLRSGASVGDVVFVSGPLGGSSAGLRALRNDRHASGVLVDAHRRPTPRMSGGIAASRAGATAMMDISDGLGLDLSRLAHTSGVGVALDTVPVAAGATLEDALGGGEDYELLFTARDKKAVSQAFDQAGEERQPIAIGVVVEASGGITYNGEALASVGYEHR